MNDRRHVVAAAVAVLALLVAIGAMTMIGGRSGPSQPLGTGAAPSGTARNQTDPPPGTESATTPASRAPSANGGLMLGEPRFRFALLLATQVDGSIAASAEIDGWVAGRDVRWVAVSGTGLAGHVGEEASIGGRTVVRGGEGWAVAPGPGTIDPWRLLDVASAAGAIDLAGPALQCTTLQQALSADALAQAFGPDGLPGGTTGALGAAPLGGGCELSFYAHWSTGRTAFDWSRVLTVQPDRALPPIEAVVAGGYPGLDLLGEDDTTSATPTAQAGGTAVNPAESPGSDVTFRVFGSMRYQAEVLGISAPQPSFDVAATSARYDTATAALRVNVSLAIGARDSSVLGTLQGDFSYGIAVRALFLDGVELTLSPDVTADGCQLTARTTGSQVGTCVLTVPLSKAPRDSVRLYLAMTGVDGVPAVGHSALWLTLLPRS